MSNDPNDVTIDWNNTISDNCFGCSYEILTSGNIKWDTFNIKTKKLEKTINEYKTKR